MSDRFAVPSDLKREPWWRDAQGLSFDEVLDRLHGVDTGAVKVLFDDFLDLYRVPKSASERAVDTMLARETLGAWVEKWRPLKDLVSFGRLERLRKALTALDRVLASPAPAGASPSSVSVKGAIAAMDLRVLGDRAVGQGAVVPDTLRHILSPWGLSQTVGDFLQTSWGKRRDIASWFEWLADDLGTGIRVGAAARAARLEGWRSRGDRPFVPALLALRERLAATELPPDERTRDKTTWRWNRLSDTIDIHTPGLLACLTGKCAMVAVSLDAEPPRVACERGDRPCRAKLAAVEALLDFVTSDAESSRELREHLAAPGWQRLLTRLRLAGAEEPAEHGRLGWVLKSPGELQPSWIEPKKSGGWKATKIAKSRTYGLEAEHAGDGTALRIVATIDDSEHADPVLNRSEVAQALSALAGHPRVFTRFDKELLPVRVEVVTPRVEVLQGEQGSRLEVRMGAVAVDPAQRPWPGQWMLAVDAGAGVLRVGFWSRAMHRAWSALKHEVAVPAAAGSALAETLLAVGTNVPVKQDASWLGEAHAPARDVVFRLGFEGPRGGKVLTVEARVWPVPELGAMVPGEGDEIVPVRRDGKVGHVVRALEEERDAATALARAAGLSEGAFFDWRVAGLEPAIAIWMALTAAAEGGALRVEWKTRPPEVQRNRRVDRLQLRLGLKKDWLDVKGGFQLDGGELPIAELLNALRDKKRFVEVDDQRVLEIGEALGKELAPLAALVRGSDGKGEGALRTSILAAPLLAELEKLGATVEGPPEWLSAHERLGEAATLEVPVPSGLRAELRPYQREGLTWAGRLAHWARGACLADEMGLGKTLQALALLLRREALGRALVIAPTSVVPNWLREAARFTPSLEITAIARGAALPALDAGAPVVVTSWDLVVRHEERFRATAWATVVLDEAHAMKNAATRRAQVIKALPAGFLLALTGTPVENRPSELWSLFQAVAPGLLGSAESFRESFGKPIAEGDAEAVRRLARLARPFILRRTKAEVASDLPDKTEVRVDVVLSAEERELYEKVRKSALAQLARDGLDALPSGQRIFKVLVVLTRLRQLACHPRLVEPKAGPGSAKIERLLELMSELRDEGRKVLVFSQFTELLALVRAAFEAAGMSYAYLDGSTPAERRMSEVDRFQAGAVDAFLLSLKAGGVGLNLTAASEVIHLDPWWNPAVEDQATGRAHRIGQDKPVTVYRLVAQGTIEEQILGLHGDKRQMVASLLEGTGSAAAVTAEELMALLSEEGLEASAPEITPEPVGEPERSAEEPAGRSVGGTRRVSLEVALPAPAAPSSRSAKAPPSATGDALARVLEALEDASGTALRRADLIAASGIPEAEWNAVRAALEDDGRVVVSGQARGRSYRWVGPSA